MKKKTAIRRIFIVLIVSGVLGFGWYSFYSSPDISDFLGVKETPYSAKMGDAYYHSDYNAANDPFFIGSITKVFTATLIFYLEEQGKLRIDDNVNRYIDNPKIKDAVKIKTLLNHTSGIRDDDEIATFIQVYQNQEKTYTAADFLANSKFTDDRSFVYANSNYVLLGDIIKVTTGKNFNQYVNEIIVQTLRLKNTCDVMIDKNCNPQKGYLNLKLLGMEDKYVQLENYTAFHTIAGSAGNLVSNLEDLDIFLQALVNNTFFDFSKMTDQFSKDTQYAYGIKNFGDGLYGHFGQTLDAASLMIIDTNTHKTYIILTGDSSMEIEKLFGYFSSK